MCLGLYREDPGPRPVAREQIEHTLAMLRDEPSRGRVLVLEVDGRPEGYALLIAFWSNELGGEVCEVDELFVNPYTTVARAAQHLGVTSPTAAKTIEVLEKAGMLAEATGRGWGRVWLARPILSAVEATTAINSAGDD